MNKQQTMGKQFTATALAVAALTPVPGSSQVLEEVIVSAQKRSQSIQEVPIAISAFSGDAIDRLNARNIQNMVDRVPGLSGKGASGSAATDTISVRGITTNDFGIGGDPSIGLFRNGIYEPRMAIFHDMERLEVLRGPQGLLFGRGAASGAINMITAKADPEAFSGQVSVGGGERGQKRARLVVNTPLSEHWAGRFSGHYDDIDGYVENLLGGDDLGWDEQRAARLSLRYSADSLTVNMVADYEDQQQSGTVYSLQDGDDLSSPLTGDSYTIASDLQDNTRNDNEVVNLGLIIDYEFENATLTALTAYRTWDRFYREDFDGAPFELIDYSEDIEVDFFSQEFRLVSSTDGPWDWFIGASAFIQDRDARFAFVSGEETICELFAGFTCGDVIPGFQPSPNGYVESGRGESEASGAALYGELGYSINEAWRLSLGLRYNYDKREFTQFSNPVSGDVYEAFGRLEVLYGYETGNAIESDESWTYLAPRILVEYAPNDDLNLYASFVKGSKPGGFDSFTSTSVVPGFPTPLAAPGAEVNSFDEEVVNSFEAGAKGAAMGGKLNYALSAYYYDYSDMQRQVIRNVFPTVENIGEATGTGVELEITARPHDLVDINLGLAWADSEIDDIDVDVCASLSGQSCEGNVLPVNPEFTASFALTGRIPMGDKELHGTIEYLYSDEYFVDLENNPRSAIESYDEVNISLGLNIGERLTLSAFVENVTDEKYFSYGEDVSSLGMLIGWHPVRPRTWGADITYRFGE